MPLGAARDGLIAAQARLIVTLTPNADLEQRNAGHQAVDRLARWRSS
jgi:hypothetical protein